MNETNSTQENPILETTLDHTVEVDAQSTVTTKEATADPFDPSHLRLSQNFAEAIDVKKALTTVPVRKPDKQEYIRVDPRADYRLNTVVLELKEERENYLVDRPLWGELNTELTPKALFTTMNRQGVLTLWPVRLPGGDGKLDPWNTSALQAAEMAQKDWIRVVSNMSLQAYEIYKPKSDLPDPDWPELSFTKILNIAFKDHYITNIEHPVIRRLRGEL